MGGIGQDRLQRQGDLYRAALKYCLFYAGIYEKNIEIKSSAFQDVSDYGSVAESVVGNRKTINNPKPSQVPIQEVIMEEDINPAPPPKNIMPPVAPPSIFVVMQRNKSRSRNKIQNLRKMRG